MIQPKDENGRYVQRQCPNPACNGELAPQGGGNWACNGLVDPNNSQAELEVCTFSHKDGEPYNMTAEQYIAWSQKHGRSVNQVEL